MSIKKKKYDDTHEISEQINGVLKTNTPHKRFKCDIEYNRDSQNKKNFIKACEIVSEKAYNNCAERLNLFHIPTCMRYELPCKHFDDKFSKKILEMPHCVRQAFDIKRKADMWCEALEVCILCITQTQYLSSSTLKDIVDIMLNVHEDFAGRAISHVIDKCQRVLSLHFSMHPPCLHDNIRKCYTEFLISPIDLMENTYSNRKYLKTNDGIVHYCINKLEEELSAESIDGPLIEKNIPTEMQKTMEGTLLQKQKLCIFETLKRSDRIDRLMVALYSIIELLQSDLAIRQAYRSAAIKRKWGELLMASILQREKTVNSKIYMQIFKIYCYFVHLDYPEEHIKTMSLWLHLVMETFYVNDKCSDMDYPNIGATSSSIIKEFHRILLDLPQKSIIKILGRIEPLYMRHEVGLLHSTTLLNCNDDDIINIFINFVERSEWKDFPKSDNPMNLQKKMKVKKDDKSEVIKELFMICKNPNVQSDNNNIMMYPKYDKNIQCGDVDQSIIEYTLCITMQAYLDTYSIKNMQAVLNRLINKLEAEATTSTEKRNNVYSISESFIKRYRSIYRLLQKFISVMGTMKDYKLPEEIQNFIKENFENMCI